MPGRGQAVLVVDDEPVIAAAFGQALRLAGHRVNTATTVAAALAAPSPAVLVVDLDLGDLTGLDLLEALQRRGDSPSAVFVSGLPTFEDCRDAMRLGAVEMLQKPFPMDELLRAVADALAVKGQSQANTTQSSSPSPNPQTWSRAYPATADSIERAARDLGAYLLRSCVAPAARARSASALAEVMDNACRHAGLCSTSDLISVEALLAPRELQLTIRDQGRGLPTLSPAERQRSVHESGLARAAALAESLHLKSQPGLGTTVQMTFGVQRARFEDEGIIDLTELDFLSPDDAKRVLGAVAADDASSFHLSPAIAVSVGRYLAADRPQPSAASRDQHSIS